VHDSAYFSVFFRTTTTEIDKGIWPEAKLMYMELLKDDGGKWIGLSHISEQTKTITFPSGARTAFGYLTYDKDADSYYGSEIAKIYFEEFQFRSSYQFEVLRSRNRSRANVVKGIRCTLNPDPTHFVYEWVKPFLDEEGYPIKDLSGKTRYYLVVDGGLITSWEEEPLRKQYKKNPQTYTYIPATIEDNLYLNELDKDYKDNLDSLGEVKRKQLLLGCWAATNDAGLYFNRSKLLKTDCVPSGATTVRAFDLAHSIPTQNYRNPDYTACIKMSRCRDGLYYIQGDYIDEFGDEDTPVKGRVRMLPGPRNRLMLKQAAHDGEDVEFVIPQDTAAGKETFMRLAAEFAREGFKVFKHAPGNQVNQKFKNFESFSAALDNGLIYILENTFNRPTLDWLYGELEMFDGITKSSGNRKDEAVDIVSAAFLRLSSSRPFQLAPRNQTPNSTISSDVIRNNKQNSSEGIHAISKQL
jgi:phage terminase large subunit-like protein